jgi:hypothetical protein
MPLVRRLVIAAVCGFAVLAGLFLRYTHSGYVAAVDSGAGFEIEDRGIHIRMPWHRATFYPIRCRQTHLEAQYRDRHGRISFDMVVALSVSRDSVPSLHRAYGGAYLEALVTPSALEFFKARRGDPGIWREEIPRQEVMVQLIDHLNRSIGHSGVRVYQGWLHSFEVIDDPAASDRTLGD